jgi:ATP-dependent DNA helicase RecG
MKLAAKGENLHLLAMTATPIPRSLAMTAFGDMDHSALDEKPAGRKPIDTRVISLARAEEVLEGVGRAMRRGEKIYWICPMVEETAEESDDEEQRRTDLAAATSRHAEFSARFGPRVALAHGRMKPLERDAMMAGFAGDAYDMLVATTVVEVGVDVQDATIIVIEHAERFGLAQLHQLRGRVGRGDKPSHCILLYFDRCSEVARARLRALRETEDGFRLAEEDLRLRGGGDVLGVRQSGLPSFRFADLAEHGAYLRVARDDVKRILKSDPSLASERGQALRHLLYLFRYDENIRYLYTG